MAEEYESTLKANIKRLSEIGAEVEEIGVSERIFEKLNEQELALHRLTNLTRDFVTGRELKDVRRYLEDKFEKMSTSLEARLRDQEFAIGRLTDLSKGFATTDDVGDIKASIDALRSSLEERIGDLEKSLKDDIKGLSQVDSEIIDDLGKMETLFGKLDEQEVSIQKLRDLCNTFVGEKELLSLREDISKDEIGGVRSEMAELKTSMESRITGLETGLRDDIKGLTEVDSEIIDRLSKIEELAERVNDQSVSIRKLTDLYEGFIDRKTLESFRESIKKEELEALRGSLEEKLSSIPRELGTKIDDLSMEVKRLSSSARDFTTKSELRSALEERVGSLEKSFRETVKTLSEVDSKIIDDLGRLDRLSEKIRDQDVSIRKLSEMYEGFVGERELREMQSSLERSITRFPREIDARVRSLEGRIRELERVGRRKTKSELEEEKKSVLALISKLKEDFERGAISKAVFEEAQKEHKKHLASIESELREATVSSKLAERIKSLETTVKKLSEQVRRQERRISELTKS
jgi:chromosome segregation ATPase